jgi:hypothetical protein
MLRPLLTASALCLLACTPAANAELSYSYLQGALFANSTDTPAGEQDGVGGEFSASYEILSYLHVFAGTRYTELDDLPLDSTLIQAGVGVNYDPAPNKSLYFNLAAVSAEADLIAGGLGTISADDEGYAYAFGYREIGENGRIEFALSVEHMEFDQSAGSDTWIDMGLQFRVTPRFKIETAVRFVGDENAFKVGVRYYLPNRFDRR